MNDPVILTRRSASAMKTVYAAIFGWTAYTILLELWLPDTTFRESLEAAYGTLSEGDIRWLEGLVRIYAIVVALQLFRIYITLEMAEDRFTELHENSIAPLGSWGRFFEQSVRISLVIMISWKVVQPAGSIAGVAWYLVKLYILLLSWDFVVLIAYWRAHRSTLTAGRSRLRDRIKSLGLTIWRRSFLPSSFLGLSTAIVLFLAAPSKVMQSQSKGVYTALIVALTIAFSLLLISFLADILQRRRDYARYICQALGELFLPRYGDRCELEACPGRG